MFFLYKLYLFNDDYTRLRKHSCLRLANFLDAKIHLNRSRGLPSCIVKG